MTAEDVVGFIAGMICVLIIAAVMGFIWWIATPADTRPSITLRCPHNTAPYKDVQAHGTIVSCLKLGEPAPVFKFEGR